MREAEAWALENVSRFPAARRIIAERGKRTERTVGAAIDRLERAVDVVFKRFKNHPQHRLYAREAKRQMEIAQQYRWALAMSARRIPEAEARKHAANEEDRKDLLQAGLIGLMDAAKRFDPARGFRFATYAAWWVRARMTRALTPHAVTVPPHLNEKRMRLRKARAALEGMGTGWSIEDLARESGMPIETVEFLLRIPLTTVYLDQNTDDDAAIGRETRPIDALVDESQQDTADTLSSHADLQWLKGALDKISDREAKILDLVYGISSGRPMSLAAAGKRVNLSRERVRQICRSAIQNLRTMAVERQPVDPELIDYQGETHRISSNDILEIIGDEPMQMQQICLELTGHYDPRIRQRIYSHLSRLRAQGVIVQEGHSRNSLWRRARASDGQPGDGTVIELGPPATRAQNPEAAETHAGL
jgi:RNA polymerase sigma factor (sigma-70 family)